MRQMRFTGRGQRGQLLRIRGVLRSRTSAISVGVTFIPHDGVPPRPPPGVTSRCLNGRAAASSTYTKLRASPPAATSPRVGLF